jgi:hypothetical protein
MCCGPSDISLILKGVGVNIDDFERRWHCMLCIVANRHLL